MVLQAVETIQGQVINAKEITEKMTNVNDRPDFLEENCLDKSQGKTGPKVVFNNANCKGREWE